MEAIRALRTARRSAGHARTTALNQMRALLVSGPDDLRAALRGSTVFELVTTAARLRPTDPTTAVGATKLALRELARRVQRLEAERRRLDAVLEQLVATTAPALVACFGVGTDTAGALLVSAGDNPQRLRSEAAFAHHCGVAPIDASSGLTIRKRLNRGGDRTANQALWRIVMVRMVHDPRTRSELDPVLRTVRVRRSGGVSDGGEPPFVVDGAEVGDRAVAPARVVPALDPLEDRRRQLGAGLPATAVEQLEL